MTVTEFESLDPDEFHLVPKGASGFPVLLAKAVEDSVDAELAEKKRLNTDERDALPDSDFALPDKREYPINDETHAREALSMLHNASPDEQKRIKAAVHRRYPDIGADDAAKQTAPDKTVPAEEAESQTRETDPGPQGPVPSPDNADSGEARDVTFDHNSRGDGGGDTAPDKDIHRGEAESQTGANIEGAAKAEADGTGSHPDDKDLHEDEAESQTDDDAEGNTAKADADSDPGSPAWEDKDVALGEEAEHLATQLEQVARTFTEREKAEGSAGKAALGGAEETIRRAIGVLRGLGPNINLPVSKEIEDMNHDELMKLLDERDEARRQAKKAKKDKAARKAAEAEAAKATEEVAKAADTEVAAKADEQIASLQKQIDELSAKRPFVNGVGVTAALRGADAPAVFKSLDDAVASAEAKLEKATTDFGRQQAKTELEGALRSRFMAKMVARDNAQARGVIPPGRFGPNSTDLFAGSTLSLAEDTAVKGI